MANPEIVELDDVNWEENVEKTKKPVVVMFYTNTCPYCKQMEPHFNEYAGEFKEKVLFAKVNIMNNPTISNRYGVMGTPTFKFFCNGKPIHELVGAIYPSLLKKSVEEKLEHGPECVKNTTWTTPENIGYT